MVKYTSYSIVDEYSGLNNFQRNLHAFLLSQFKESVAGRWSGAGSAWEPFCSTVSCLQIIFTKQARDLLSFPKEINFPRG